MAEQTRRPRIAYFTINDPRDKRSWSGASYYIGKTLEKNVGDVDILGPVKIPWVLDKFIRALQKLSRFFFKTEWIPKYSLLKNIYASFILTRKMRGKKFDFIFGAAAAPELACLNTTLPVIYFGDATYKSYSETYKKEFRGLNSFSRWEGNYLEKRALKISRLVIFSSKWAVNSAVTDYHTPLGKLEVIQMGANIDHVPDHSFIYKKEQNKLMTLLFLSVDWERKGGPIAFDTLECISETGTPIKLIVCGCTPPQQFTHPNMEVIPFLNKNNADDFERFGQILSSVHFLLLPTRADCTPIVNAESNAYGIPVITTDVGGVSEAVKNNINGYCLPLEATGDEYAQVIMEIFSDKERYHSLIESSRSRFDEELNWDTFAEKLNQVLYKHNIIQK